MENVERLKQTRCISIRNNQFSRSKASEAGITLIALVITIIVLLILAGVTIATLTGENGILTQAQNAKTASDIAEVKEQAQLDIANWTAERLKNGEDATLDDATVKSIIESANQNNTNKYYSELTDTSIKTKQGNEILLSDLYTKTEISASKIANSENKSDYYGAVVSNYTVNSSVRGSDIQWKIFYADENNIYLIADDYISYQYVPKGKKGSEIYINSNNYDLSFNNIVNDYEGFSDVSSDKIKELNSDYFEKN